MEFFDIENHIDRETIEKGRCLYQEGAIKYLQKSTDSSWEAEILDGETYEALLIFKNRDLKELRLYACDCEDQPQILCPHITAVLISIRDGLKMMAKNKDNDLIELPDFDETGYPDTEGFKSIIGSALSEIWNSEGEIDYFHTPVLVDTIQKLYSEAESCYTKEKISICIDIITAIYEKIIPIYDLIDDADGEIGGVLSQSQNLLIKITFSLVYMDHFERIFYLFIDTIDKADVDLLAQMRFDLLLFANRLRDSEIMSKRLLDSINKMMRDYVHRDIMETSLKPVLFIKWQVLKSLRRFREANELFEENKHWPIFTNEALERTFDIGDHQGVLDLVEESQKSAEITRTSCFSVNWQKWKIKAYKSAKDIKKLRELYQQMLLEGDLSVYLDWKNTYLSEEWPKVRDGFCNNLWAYFPLAKQLLDIYQKEEKIIKLRNEENRGTCLFPSMHIGGIITFFCDYIDYLTKKAGNLEQYKEVINEIRIFHTNSNHDWILELIEVLEKKYRDGEFVEVLQGFKEEILE